MTPPELPDLTTDMGGFYERQQDVPVCIICGAKPMLNTHFCADCFTRLVFGKQAQSGAHSGHAAHRDDAQHEHD